MQEMKSSKDTDMLDTNDDSHVCPQSPLGYVDKKGLLIGINFVYRKEIFL